MSELVVPSVPPSSSSPSLVALYELQSVHAVLPDHAFPSIRPHERRALSNDDEAVALWLSEFKYRSSATVRSYKAQSQKFRLFLTLWHPDWSPDTVLLRARRADVSAYELALTGRTEIQVDGSTPDLALTDGELLKLGFTSQPFGMVMMQSSVNQALAVLNTMYAYFCTPNDEMNTPYVEFNPVRRVRKAKSRSMHKIDRFITLDGIQAMYAYLTETIDTANKLGDKKAALRYERSLWILTLLFGLWGRREEVARLCFGDFRHHPGKGWMVTVKRKGRGNQTDDIPAAPWVIEALKRYRVVLGLTPTWTPLDRAPAIQGLRLVEGVAKVTPNHAQTLYLEIKRLASETASEIKDKRILPDLEDGTRADLLDRLNRCSPHWFRHTGPTIAINDAENSMTLELAAQMLGHSSTATTSQMYYHGDTIQLQAGLNVLGDKLKASVRR